MNYQPQNPPPTFESVWASLQETDRLMKEQFAENERQRKKEELKWEEFRKPPIATGGRCAQRPYKCAQRPYGGQRGARPKIIKLKF